MEDDDDWDFDLSAEQLESLERDALLKVSQQRQFHNQPTSSSSSASSLADHQRQHRSQVQLPNNQLQPSPSIQVDAFAGGSKVPLQSIADEHSKVLPNITVKYYLHASGNIAAKFSYNQVVIGALRQIPKATWNAKERVWMFPLCNFPLAEKALCQINTVKIEFENLDPLVQRAISAASAVPDLRDRYEKMPAVLESKLLPFQRDGVRFALHHGGRVLLADEMGLGKTLQAIALASCVQESWPVLIISPSSLRLHWASMIQQWLNVAPSDILVVLSQFSGSNKSGFTIVTSGTKGTVRLDGLFNIISYDVVPKLQNLLLASEFKVVIADESHFLKNAQAKRTTASLPVIKKAQYAILLSGTPALSRPIELFKQLEALCPDVYKNVHEYGNRYCKGGVFGVYQGASNHDELHNLMKATLMIRRLKKDVLTELPMKRRQQIFLDMSEKDMKKVNALFRELEVVKGKIKACRSKEETDAFKFAEKNLINKIYIESAEAKIPAVLDYLATIIEAGCKFLIFAHHRPMIDSIHQFLISKKVESIRIDGNTPAASRHGLVKDFQEKESVKAAVLSIRAGGVGLTLTAASTVVFAELSWTPGDLIQAEDRAHRIGQAYSVNVYYLLANDTVDDIIWDVVQNKLENLGQMLDGHENTMEVAVTEPKSSPTKQTTLDSFVKRCDNTVNYEGQPKLKHSRH